MKYKSITNRFASIILSTCLIAGNVGALPLSVYAAEEESEISVEEASSDEQDIDAEVANLLSAGEYEEGSVIVMYDKVSPTADGEEVVGASALLNNAETVTDVSAESFVNATGQTLALPDEELVGASGYSNDDRIAIAVVEDDSKSTEELLRELLSDPRVLTAEPDYIISTADMEENDLENAADAVLDETFLESTSTADSIEDDTEVAATDIPSDSEEAAVAPSAADAVSEDTEVAASDADVVTEDSVVATSDANAVSGDTTAAASTANVASDEPAGEPDTNAGSEAVTEAALPGADESVAAAAEEKLTLEEVGANAAETVVGKTPDLTPYQWGMSDANNCYFYRYYEREKVYAMHIPNWNQVGTTNAEGVVAVVDTGVDQTHPDLADSMYHFSAEAQSALGCGEYGKSVVPKVREVTDTSDRDGHGTHCAGIIAASWNDAGISGVASGCKIMAVRALDDAGKSSYITLVKGLAFVEQAKEYGVDVRATSNSFGGSVYNYAMRAIVEELGSLGVVCIFASGNDDNYINAVEEESTTLWDLPNTVIVNASDEDGRYADFTNFSQNETHIFAPGVNILSTICENDDPNQQRTYFAEWDPRQIYFDPSWDRLSDQLFAPVTEGWMTEDYMNYFSYTKMYEFSCEDWPPSVRIKFNMDLPVDASFTLCLFLPIDEDIVTDNVSINYASLGILAPDLDEYGGRLNDLTVGIRMVGTDSNGKEVTKRNITTLNNVEWVDRTVAGLSELKLIEESDGKYYVPMYVDVYPKQGASIKEGDFFYIDNACLGSAAYDTPSTLYTYMSGTSMATPGVAGAAMVLYNGKTVSKANAEQVAAELKSRVRKNDMLADYCTSGGVLDLSVTGDQMLPVINSAVLNASDKTITLSGYYFGSLGNECKVTLAGTSLEIVSWSDGSITVKCPDTMASGLQKIIVTTASGTTARGAFSITVPESSGIKDSALPLYEKTLANIPSELCGTNQMIVQSAGLEDYIYVTVGTLYNYNIFAENLIRYSIKNDSWENVDEIPYEGLNACSMAAFQGAIYLSGTDENGKDRLVRYVPSSGKWYETLNCGSSGSTLVNFNNSLLYVGGLDEKDYGNTIRLIDVPNGTLTTIGTLPIACGAPYVAALDDTLYIYSGIEYNAKTKLFDTTSKKLYCYTQSGDTFERDESKEIDITSYKAKAHDNLTGTICASDKDVYLVAAYLAGDGSEASLDPNNYSVEDGDTWILDGQPFNYGKRLSHTITYLPIATVYKGVLYGFGLNTQDGDPKEYVLRATTVDKKPEAPVQDPIIVKIPKAVQGLVYNGKAQIGVPASADGIYTISNNKKTAAGTYKATVSLIDPEQYVWEDGTTTDKTITWTIKEATVHVKSVKLNKSNLTLYVGKTGQLTATVSPSNAANKKVTWKSANTKIATVDKNGKVTAKAKGTVKVTVTTADGKKTATCTVKVLKRVAVYRLYNQKGNGDHLFTTSVGEKNNLMLHGWKYEGIAWYTPEKTSIPVYRFYNKSNGTHMYTASEGERKAMISAGWKQEGIAFYAATTTSSRPAYRLYNPNSGQHFFTVTAGERNTLKNAGWKTEGVGFQVLK